MECWTPELIYNIKSRVSEPGFCIIDSSEAKQGNFAPGSGLPIVHPDILYKVVRLNVFWLWLQVTMRKLLVF